MGGRWLSGLLAAAFALLIVGLGGWWFTLSIGVIVHLALLEFFRLAEFKGIRPAIKTTLVVCQLLLISTQLAPGSALAAAVLPLAGSVICGWLLLQPITGSIADIAASIFGLFYLGSMLLSLFGVSIGYFTSSGPLAIGINLAIAGVAALNLVLDFDRIEQGVRAGAPKQLEWFAAFGLMVTLVWLYLELLRLLSRLQGRRD